MGKKRSVSTRKAEPIFAPGYTVEYAQPGTVDRARLHAGMAILHREVEKAKKIRSK